MRLYIGAAVALAVTGFSARGLLNHTIDSEPAAAAAPAPPEVTRYVEALITPTIPAAMTLEGRAISPTGAVADVAAGGWVIPDPARRPVPVKDKRAVRRGPQVSSATSPTGARSSRRVSEVGRIKDSFRLALDKQDWRRGARSLNPFRDDSRYRSRR
ncbi:MAG: hypothetical protein IT437_06585 [Phycisphaerales bacterium]|nr:hypothetical protein [Phycisphaerales bacterium]